MLDSSQFKMNFVKKPIFSMIFVGLIAEQTGKVRIWIEGKAMSRTFVDGVRAVVVPVCRGVSVPEDMLREVPVMFGI